MTVHPPEAAPLRAAFLDAMSRVAATVHVVTTGGPAGRAGVTVSAMSSVSADGAAPTLLICLHHEGSASETLLANGRFCLNVLREGQEGLANFFAGRGTEARSAVLADLPEMAGGVPRLSGPLAALACRVADSHRIGTHHVILGAVEHVHLPPLAPPLIYAQRGYAVAMRPVTGAGTAWG